MKHYEVKQWTFEINEVEVEKTTKAFAYVVYKDGHGNRCVRRQAIQSESCCLFESRAEAVKWKRKQLEAAIDVASRQLKHAQDKLEKFNTQEVAQ